MNEIDKVNLTDQTRFRLNEINKIENYFNSEISLSATKGGVCTVSHATVVGAPVGIASAGFTIIFSLATGIIKNYQTQQEIKRKSTIKFLCWLKVNLIALKL